MKVLCDNSTQSFIKCRLYSHIIFRYFLPLISFRYMVHFRADSRVSLDLRSLDAILPSAVSMDIEGRAYWLPPIDTADCSDFSLNNEISNESSTYVADDISGVRIDMDSSTIGIIPRLQRTSIPRICPSILVVGAEKDFVVDQEGVEETARFLGVKPIFIPEGYHDVMLGPKWRLSADVIAKWLQSV